MLLDGELNRLRWFTRYFTVKKYFKTHTVSKLHIGCGRKIIKGYLNGDKFSFTSDIYLDAYHRLPFKDNIFKYIFLEHLIEHIKLDRIPFFLSELFRVLEPKGVVRITCPDLDIFVRMYYENNSEFFKPILTNYAERMKHNRKKYGMVQTEGAAFNTRVVYRFYHHRWLYDFETLSVCLREAGFKKIIKQKFKQSLIGEVEKLDSKEKEIETLYIDAQK